ncbi:putative peptidyl-tRNA hydrolase PTRHD1 [Thelohanellus kitauei]|uniref:peptidyl-tRNA hydrolase n=1 Tax=Thelohanellus kitauei TaxID=669202 RepID=A0A0C2J1H7_THEKT|nr:putative peptidyl-tRNA hydrolase PTRHD1 [Thelohanellus kitauei]
MCEKLVQYILLREDLIVSKSWTWGALIAQACHASTACIHTYYDDPYTMDYLMNLDHMTKIVLKLKDGDNLTQYENILDSRNLKYYSWIERPENIKTCLATKPYPKTMVQDIFRCLKLFN